VAFAMDGLKTAVANVADLLDRQMALLCSGNNAGRRIGDPGALPTVQPCRQR